MISCVCIYIYTYIYVFKYTHTYAGLRERERVREICYKELAHANMEADKSPDLQAERRQPRGVHGWHGCGLSLKARGPAELVG